MRKLIFLLMGIAFVAGCSNTENKDKPTKENEVGQNSESSQIERENQENGAYVPNPQVIDDRQLVNEGESIADEKGEAELIAYKKMEYKLEIGPIEMIIHEAKVLEFRPDYSLIDFYHGYTHEEKFPFVKVFVEISNNSDRSLNFAPVAFLQTSMGEKKSWEEDIYLEELNGEIKSGEKKQGNLGFILSTSNIDSFTMTTSKVLEGKEEISNEKVIEVEF
ncbi:DUF4352 domain-containing protein [Bacillus sp. REN3]|uniref:DUF4352 domain-containing protein n=1 Tax=Bacillus sp. REN3 TaxID=2802440 RepID=UPI001AEDCEE8|nr:DUF4352 domain-containing protein [Bacillus sp. REN3]